MNYNLKVLITVIIILFLSCQEKDHHNDDITISPEAGTSYKAGAILQLKSHYGSDVHPDSIVYFIDSLRVGISNDSSLLSVRTDSFTLGYKTITAKIYQAGKSQEASGNITLFAAKPPQEMTYRVVRVFPHDTSAYTEGLVYEDGFLYESTGSEGHSTLRKVELGTGKVVQMTKLDPKYFGEGISIIGNKIIMLTYKQPEKAFVYDKSTFQLLSTFDNNVGVEGWGMTFDGRKLYFDDSTNRIWSLDKDTYRTTGYIDVYTDKVPVDSVNELEFIEGKLYANIYQKEDIITINPKTGAVLQSINMHGLWPTAKRPHGFDNDQNVLNGIAWDEKGKRLFVTGKKWPYLYQVEFTKAE